MLPTQNLTLTDTTALALDAIGAGPLSVNNLTVFAVGITQVDVVTATGNTVLDAQGGGGGAITLLNAANDFADSGSGRSFSAFNGSPTHPCWKTSRH